MNFVDKKFVVLAVIISFALIGILSYSYLNSAKQDLEDQTASIYAKSLHANLVQLESKGYSFNSRRGRSEIRKQFTILTDSGSILLSIHLIDLSKKIRISSAVDAEG